MAKKTWTKELLIEAVQKSQNYSDVARYLNLSINGNTTKTLKKAIYEYNLDINHFQKTKPTKHKLLSNFLIENSTFKGTGQQLKKRLLRENLIKDECILCHLTTNWNGKSLVLQLDHINGVHNDNRLENLRILCPNCHSQTETFSGKRFKKHKTVNKKESFTDLQLSSHIKKRKVKNRPTKNELDALVKEKGYAAVGKIYNVSDNTIRKWLKAYGG